VLTVAMLHAVLMAFMERRLHRARAEPVAAPGSVMQGPLASLPPLLTMERMLFVLIGIGFVLLTLTLATGILLVGVGIRARPALRPTRPCSRSSSWLDLRHPARRTDASTAGAAVLRMRWTLAGFLMVMLAGIGSRFVLEVVLERG
jgi:ABC-type uncharacterized transport system permease subunit